MEIKTLYASMNERLTSNQYAKGVMIYDLNDFYIYRQELINILGLEGEDVNSDIYDIVCSKVLWVILYMLITDGTLQNIKEFKKLVINTTINTVDDLYINAEIDLNMDATTLILDIYKHIDTWLDNKGIDKSIIHNNHTSKAILVEDIQITFVGSKSDMYIVFKLIERE
jgi:hypothetical protein